MTVNLWHLSYMIYLDDVLEAYLLESLMHLAYGWDTHWDMWLVKLIMLYIIDDL
jgi:hypothetical protein